MKLRNIILACAAAVLASCAEPLPEEPLTPETADYNGTVTVTYQESDFNNENIDVNFTPSEDGLTASITIYKIRFVPQMPVTIDVTVPQIQLTSTVDKIMLSCEKVIPLAMGGEFPRYTVTGLVGEISDGTLTFSLNFGDYPTRFSGKVKVE